MWPTLSLGMIRKSDPYFSQTFPAVWLGLIPIPSLERMALVSAEIWNSSAAYFNTAVNGALSGTLMLLFSQY